MGSPSGTLEGYPQTNVESGSRLAILFAQCALFTATLFVQKTRFYAKYDRTGIITALSYQISAVLVSYSRHLSQLGFIHGRCGGMVSLMANLSFCVLAIFFEKFYENSFSSLCFTLSVTVLLLILLFIIRPLTDLGLFGFLIGVVGSVAYNLFELKLGTWIVVAICFSLLFCRCWLDMNWLGLEGVSENLSLPTTSSDCSIQESNKIFILEIVEAATVAGFYIFGVHHLYRTNCRKIEGPPESISCTLNSILGILTCVLVLSLWLGLALVPRVYSFCQTKTGRRNFSDAKKSKELMDLQPQPRPTDSEDDRDPFKAHENDDFGMSTAISLWDKRRKIKQ